MKNLKALQQESMLVENNNNNNVVENKWIPILQQYHKNNQRWEAVKKYGPKVLGGIIVAAIVDGVSDSILERNQTYSPFSEMFLNFQYGLTVLSVFSSAYIASKYVEYKNISKLGRVEVAQEFANFLTPEAKEAYPVLNTKEMIEAFEKLQNIQSPKEIENISDQELDSIISAANTILNADSQEISFISSIKTYAYSIVSRLNKVTEAKTEEDDDEVELVNKHRIPV